MLRGKGRRLSPLGGAVRSAFSRLGLSGQLAQQRALTVWPDVVGAQIAAATRPLHIREGVLFVAAKSSAWAHELIYRKAALLEGLNKELGRGVIHDIRFLGTGYSETDGGNEELGDALPGPEEWRQVELCAEEKEAIERDVSPVADAELRARMAQAMADGLRVRRWKENRGWRLCEKCGLPHPGKTELCALCRPRQKTR